MSPTKASAHRDPAVIRKGRASVERVGTYLVEAFELIALFVIGATIVWAAAHEYFDMMNEGRTTLDGILLLFIYLELGAMVGIYFRTSRVPVKFLLYVAITVLTRFLAVDAKDLTDEKIFIITVAILVLTLAVLVIRIGEVRFSSTQEY